MSMNSGTELCGHFYCLNNGIVNENLKMYFDLFFEKL